MRGLGRKLLPSSSSSSSAALSTFSSSGAGGRGRGRGLNPPPPSHPPPPPSDSQPPSYGHGRGAAAAAAGGPHFPSFQSSSLSSLGRGGAHRISDPDSDPTPKKPIFLNLSNPNPPQFADPVEIRTQSQSQPQPQPLPPPLPAIPVAGRGKPTPAPGPAETNRHAARGPQRAAPGPIGEPTVAGPKLSREEAIKKAMEVLRRGGDVGGMGRGRGRGRGRGMGMWRGRGDVDEGFQLDLGDNADGERFVKRMGEERMQIVDAAFEEMSWRVLPSPMEEAYLDALHTNNMIEYEPEYLVEFDKNPDIDEKPPMSLEEALLKAKPFLMAYEGIKSQEEWEEVIKDLMERLPHMKELMDMYCGPDRVTAKQQQQELERVAKTIPENVPSSVKRFTDRAVLSLQSNPGWGWNRKCQFMDKLAWEVTQNYKK